MAGAQGNKIFLSLNVNSLFLSFQSKLYFIIWQEVPSLIFVTIILAIKQVDLVYIVLNQVKYTQLVSMRRRIMLQHVLVQVDGSMRQFWVLTNDCNAGVSLQDAHCLITEKNA